MKLNSAWFYGPSADISPGVEIIVVVAVSGWPLAGDDG